jgi:hypothetical protein
VLRAAADDGIVRAAVDLEPGIHIDRPNREKASSQTMKLVVALLLLATAGLMAVVTAGGWSTLQGVKPVDVAFIAIYLIMAFYVARWNRGVLPIAAALAVILAIFAAIAGPGWFDRHKTGFTAPDLSDNLLGLLTLLIIPLQVLVIFACGIAFRQAWNVEVEVRDEGYIPPPGEPVST